jgi:hypothetical protein
VKRRAREQPRGWPDELDMSSGRRASGAGKSTWSRDWRRGLPLPAHRAGTLLRTHGAGRCDGDCIVFPGDLRYVHAKAPSELARADSRQKRRPVPRRRATPTTVIDTDKADAGKFSPEPWIF